MNSSTQPADLRPQRPSSKQLNAMGEPYTPGINCKAGGTLYPSLVLMAFLPRAPSSLYQNSHRPVRIYMALQGLRNGAEQRYRQQDWIFLLGSQPCGYRPSCPGKMFLGCRARRARISQELKNFTRSSAQNAFKGC